MTDIEEARRRRWEESANWPLMGCAVAFLVAYAVPILDPGLPPPWPRSLAWVGWAAWLAFGLDYLVRLVLSRDRKHFVRRNVFDLAVIVLPMLRPLRLLRLVTLLSFLNRNAGASLRGRVAIYVSGAMGLVLLTGSLAALNAERGARGANIKSYGDALWWAATTVMTVGYGDRYPVTTEGRWIAVGLMLAGIALLGVITGSVASWLLDKVREIEADAQAATRRDVAVIAEEVRQLRMDLAADSNAKSTR